MSKLIKEIMDALSAAQKNKTEPYDRSGTVKRIEGKIAWVQLEGSDRETPIQMTIACDVGDTVQARIGGGSAWLTGNLTAPPTDDKKADRALSMASQINENVATKVEELSEEFDEIDEAIATTEALVQEVSEAQQSTNNHFWSDTSGAYVTTADHSYQSGYATRITSGGILQSNNNKLLSAWTGSGVTFYDGTSTTASTATSSAEFGATSARIGKYSETYISILSSGTDAGIKFKTKGDGLTGLGIADFGINTNTGWTDEDWPKETWYTLGYRSGAKGYYSLVNGYNCVAAHNASVAFGINNAVHAPCAMAIGMENTVGDTSKTSANSYTTATSGNCSLAVGWGLTVTGQNQLVVGSSNVADSNAAIIVGNSNSNKFTVSKAGAVTTSSWINAGGAYYNGSYKILTTGTVTATGSVAANATGSGTATASKTGYTPIGILGFEPSGSNYGHLNIYNVSLSGSTVTWRGFNFGSNTADVTMTITVLYIATAQGV